MNVVMGWRSEYAIGDAFINAAKGEIGIFGYYFGIFLAFSGVLAEAATATLSGSMLINADKIAIAISVIGLGWALYLLAKDITAKSHEEAVPIITWIELSIGICGVVNAVAKYSHDTGNGGS